MKNRKRILCIALILILIGSIGAAVLQTDFGKVTIKDVYIPTGDQQYMHALAFIPKQASEDNKLPCVITSHGWLNSAEVQDAASIELSRRGIVVIAMDAYSHGFSSSVDDSVPNDSIKNGQGMIPLVEYVTSGVLNYIDTSRIGVMGHSMGSRASCNTAVYYSKLYWEAIENAKSPESDGGETITDAEQAYADSQMKISAALPTGGAPDNISDEDWPLVHCNIGFLYGAIEEGGYSKSPGSAWLVGDSKEALTLVNSVDPSVTYVEEGKFYGNKDDGTLRVLYQPYITHPLIHFDPNSTKDIIDFFDYCFDLNTGMSNSNQLFFLKECFNLVAMVGLFMLILPMCSYMLEIPCFASLKGVEGPKLPALNAKTKKKFWFGWALCGAVSFIAALIVVCFIPLQNGTIHGYSMKNLTFFAAPTMNAVAEWTLLSAIWGFFWFFYNYKKDKAAGIRDESMIGFKTTWKEFGKTVAFAATFMGLFYAVVWFCKWLFNTDFRFWTPAVKTFSPEHVFYFFQYLPIFFAFYLSNALIVNGANRYEGMSEKKNLFLMGLGNILGCGLLWALQYGKLVLTGTVIFGAQWITVLVICFCFWQLFLAPYLLRGFYKMTGKNWVGALVVSSVYVMMGVANTAIHSTLF